MINEFNDYLSNFSWQKNSEYTQKIYEELL